MEMERPHRTANNSSSSDLFVCFTSRFCSFSHREQPKLSSSSSLTRRRLRTSGSIKGGGGGGQSSPMLILTGSKKIRGGSYSNGFENHPEPSSPKVTCIGQVRVKTRKKQGGRCCTRRRSKNQKWVQLPSTICEGLRAFGADLNCFLPCGGGRSLCSSSPVSERDGTGKRRGGSGNGSCGAVFARWVMALQEEGDEGEGEERRKMDMRVRDEEVVQGELEIKKIEEVVMLKEEDGNDGKEESERISVCIPPRNALLLMRCRSDPVRIAALAANNHYFWEESFVSNNHVDNDDDHSEEEENEEEEEGEEEVEEDDDENDEKKTQVCDEQVEGKLEQKDDEEEMFLKWVVLDEALNEENSDNEDYPIKKEEEETELGCSESTRHEQEQKEDLEEEEGGEDDDDDDGIMINWSLFESFYQVQSLESEEQKEEMQEFEESSCESSEMQLQPPRDTELMILVGESQESKTEHRASEEDQTIHTHMTCTANDHHATAQEQSATKSEEEDQEQEGEVQKSSVLPDCLLSMLYESKLSMEISKETWVCGNDFIRGKSKDQVSTFNGSNDVNDNKNRQADVMINGPDKAPTIIATQHDQPPRTSFSNPTTAKASVPVPSMAAIVMQKLVSAVAQEPFVLTRCKSEPPRPSARLVPEACSWKNQNLLLLRPSRRTGGPAPGAIGLLAQPKC